MANYLNSQKSAKTGGQTDEQAVNAATCSCGCYDIIYVDVFLNDDPPKFGTTIMKVCTKHVCAKCGKVFGYHGWHESLPPHSNQLKKWKELIAANPKVYNFTCYFFAKGEEHPDLTFDKKERLADYCKRVYGNSLPWEK